MAARSTPPSEHRGWRASRGIVFAVLAVAAAAAMSVVARPWVSATPFALFHLAIVAATLRSGPWAGWIATGLAVLAVDWLLLEPIGALTLDPPSLAALLVSGIVGGMLVMLVTRIQRHEQIGRQRQREVERLNRLYDALSRINQVIVTETARDHLFGEVCRILVERGGFGMAWIGWHDPEARRLVPVASWGDASGYLRDLEIRTDTTSEAQGPSGIAFRENRPYVADDAQRDPATVPWRARLARHGYRASAAFPIRRGQAPGGTLNVYAREAGFFRTQEVALLEEAVSDLSFALDSAEREEARRRAEAEAARERRLVDRMFESIPGVLYLYDEAGRFLRWNANFLAATGYTDEEMAARHPLDFFRGEEAGLLAERIGAVFATGEASIEAEFVAKDGSARPYLFTGRRVELDGRPCLVGIGIDISDRVQAEVERRRSEERYHSTLENLMEGGQLIGRDWRYLYLNPAAEIQNRRPNADLLGRTMLECWPGIEDTPVLGALRRCMEERVATYIETEFTFPDGTSRWFEVRAQPVPEGLFVLSIDVTGRREAEAGARELRQRLEMVVEHLREGLVIADPAGEHFHWNPAALRILGFDDLEEGRRRRAEFGTIFEIFGSDGTPLPNERWPLARVRRGESIEDLEVRVRRRDRDWERIISYAGTPVTLAEGRQLAFVTLRDVTARVKAEQALREAKSGLERSVAERTAELQTALVRAEGSDRLKSAFLATMSHELRTPLNSIIGFTGILLQELPGPLNPEQTKQLGMVRSSARHLLDLINDVLDISKIEAGQLEVRQEPLDLRTAIGRALATVKPMADQRGLFLELRAPADLPILVSDRRRVDQILLNLLHNAVKFTERGGVTLTVGLGVSVADGRPAVQIAVTDTGIGIAPDDLATLFQPFRQLDTGLARQHEGTGLGLAICRRLAQLLGGEIQATSTPGVGSTFVATLPIEPGT